MWSECLEKSLEDLRKQSRLRVLGVGEGLSFCHNDYLGLSNNPFLREAGQRALRESPAGSRGSRLLGGHREETAETEAQIADFFGAPAALLFPSGYQANIGIFQAMGKLADCVISDEKNHASMIDGMRLGVREKIVLPHQTWASWEPTPSKRYLLAAESIYSMDGDFMDADGLRAAWKKSGAFLILDEAHAAGVFEEDGRGLSAAWRDWDRMAVVVTFGKAFGVGGGAVLCSPLVREWILNTARTFIYSTALPPVVPALIQASIQLLREKGRGLRAQLWDRARRTRQFWRENDLPIGPSVGGLAECSPVIPLFIAGNDRALRFSEIMRNSGLDLKAIRYPTVPQGAERIRVSLNLVASEEQTDWMIREVVTQWKAFL